MMFFFFFQAEDGIRDAQESRGLGDVYKRQVSTQSTGDSFPLAMSRKVECTGIPESRREVILEALASCEPVAYVDVLPARRCLARGEHPEEECYMIQFKLKVSHVSRVLKLLKSRGVGEEFGTIDVYPVQFSTAKDLGSSKDMRETWTDSCCPSTAARMPTLEIHSNITGSSHLNFDHIMCVITAAGIAAVGLLTDSSPFILASFFISPLMGMIMAVTWGCVIRDQHLIYRGAKNMTWGVLLCMASGFLLALLISFDKNEYGLQLTLGSAEKQGQSGLYSSISLNTSQILSRGPPSGNVVSSAIVAILSGVAIALGQSSGISSALAGCAMSTSLLPPLVEVGLMFGLLPVYGNIVTLDGKGYTIMETAGYSMALYTVNVACVMGFAYATFKVKHIGGKTLRTMSNSALGLKAMSDDVALNHALGNTEYQEDESEEAIISTMLSPRSPHVGSVDELDFSHM
eukprot:TRINITY_DN11069_c0_g1_i2.p1 TRINITY_DN11069_c0_g1~~TRINITY_DN11069_c0_g1_i2.p1  ORF type:complete len:460 (-),score=108.70 TRINITY_DN11069_c0_g1_i2:672-2051(-)